jgi:hypothetical protein
MTIQQEFRLPSSLLETTLGWPPCGGADVTILGSGTAGLLEVLDVPEDLRAVVPEGLAALSFLTNDFTASFGEAMAFCTDVTVFDAGAPDVDLLFCTVAGVPVEIMGSYVDDVKAKLDGAARAGRQHMTTRDTLSPNHSVRPRNRGTA